MLLYHQNNLLNRMICPARVVARFERLEREHAVTTAKIAEINLKEHAEIKANILQLQKAITGGVTGVRFFTSDLI